MATGPVYVCSSCDQLLYKQAVQNANSLCKLNGEKVRSVLLGKTSVDGIEWMCHTCNRYLRRGKMPPCAIANNLKFPEVPTHLPQLFTSEWRMLSPQIAFMKNFEAAIGKQLKIHGNVVNVQQMCAQH